MRLWHAEVAIEKADDYERFMIERAAPDYSSDVFYQSEYDR